MDNTVANLSVSTRSQRSWIESLYRLQIWFYLILGALPLLFVIVSFISAIVSTAANLAGIGLFLSFIVYIWASCILLIPNYLALKNKSVYGWWMHFGSLCGLASLLLWYSSTNGGLWSVLPMSAFILLLINISISVAAKKVLFGSIGWPPFVIILLLLLSAVPGLFVDVKGTNNLIVDLQSVGGTQESVVLIGKAQTVNGKPYYLDSSSGSGGFHIGVGRAELPDAPDADWYKQRMAEFSSHSQTSKLTDNFYYELLLTNESRTKYYTAGNIVVEEGKEMNGSGLGFYTGKFEEIPQNLSLDEFPIAVLSREVLSLSGNAISGTGHTQTIPSDVLFEGRVEPVTKATQQRFERLDQSSYQSQASIEAADLKQQSAN